MKKKFQKSTSVNFVGSDPRLLEKKVKSTIKHSQVPLTSYKGITKPKKAPLSFKFVKTQIMSGSQDQKERKTASTVTTIFFKQKITTAQIRFCNYRFTSRFDE